ncbi:MAG: FKBP-type peptidyl-prolyl cis-trans isomerase [Planctomycetota bacterium]|nr:FKBP-type peptidyl-prolyl cis-trans isomerase [Planctomycetaceae bacterium]MDQ3331880.1 FKBP-type peptidyl-prolyl cis-trans isomerase [Planctomycetota bacterium]
MILDRIRRAGALAFLFMPAVAVAQPAEPPAAEEKPAASPPGPSGDGEFKTFEEKLSYAVGLNAGRVMQQQGLNPDPDIFMRGFKDSFKETDPLLTDEEIQEVFAQVQNDLQAKKNAKWDEMFAEKNKSAGEPKTTKSGLKYEVYAEGKGAKPKGGDTVVVHYAGKLPDGKVFDSSVARGEPLVIPVKSGPGGVIAGWVEGLKLMSPGAKYKLYIPSDLAYGKEGRPPRIPPNQDLVFEVELIDILPAQNGAAGQQ